MRSRASTDSRSLPSIRDQNTVADYDVDQAIRLVTLKLVGYTEVVHQLAGRLSPDASILLFGGLAKDRPYPGSTTVSTVNGAVSTLIRTLAIELAPVRVNAIHPGIVADTPFWSGKEEALARTCSRARRRAGTSDVRHRRRVALPAREPGRERRQPRGRRRLMMMSGQA